MALLGSTLRLFTYLYHFVLSLLLIGLTIVITSGNHTVNLDMTPWPQKSVHWWTLATGLAGLVTLLLAWIGKWRVLFLIHAVAIVGLVFKGYFFSGYRFSSDRELWFALAMAVASLLTTYGAWSIFRQRPAR